MIEPANQKECTRNLQQTNKRAYSTLNSVDNASKMKHEAAPEIRKPFIKRLSSSFVALVSK